MQTRSLGSLHVSVVGVGCNNFGSRLDAAATANVVHGALDAGVNFFDSADIYGATQSEVLLGRALAGAHPDYVRQACEDSLRRLDTEYLDLYQLHYPDDTVPIADTLGALGELVHAGKVREIGCSNLNPAQLRDATLAAGDGPAFVSVQNQFSLLAREPERDGVLDTCTELNLKFLPFYPLANGLLTGKFRPGEPLAEGSRLAAMSSERSVHWLSEGFQHKVSALLTYAQEIDVPILSLAFSWLLSHPQVASVIAGATSPDQVRANVGAVRDLTSEQLQRLNELTA